MRKKRYYYSVISSVVGQIVTAVCGIILPGFLIRVYGSEVYGATTSITQFLSYIALLEGGIGGVARAALYKPLANHDIGQISKVVFCIKRFFRIIAVIFCVYTLGIACCYNFLVKNNTLDWSFSFLLVIVISFSSLAQYYFGFSYSILLQADQRVYVTTTLNFLTTLVNTLIACGLALIPVNIIVLKFVWCLGHFVRIAILNWYVERKYHLVKCKSDGTELPQKWDGLGQHIAYFLHNNTDVVVLTAIVGLKEVSVYSIYYYIASSLNTIVMTCAANMEAVFGELLARDEKKKLNDFFDKIELILNVFATICFSTAICVILPFIKIYTDGVTDVEYQRPFFSVVILLTQLVTCIRQPYHTLTIAAGHFKKTAWAAYLEAGLNITLSVLLCYQFGMLGVVLATLVSVLFRMIYYIIYDSKNIIFRSPMYALKRLMITATCVVLNVLIGTKVTAMSSNISNYGNWVIVAAICFVVVSLVTISANFMFYPHQMKSIATMAVRRVQKKR